MPPCAQEVFDGPPEAWIPDVAQKLDAYRLLATARDAQAVLAARDALRDRYGPLPKPARTLVRVHLLRVACDALRVARVQSEGKVAILWYEGDGERLRERLAGAKRRALWPEPGVCYLLVSERPGPPHTEVLRVLIETLVPEPEAALRAKEEPVRAGDANMGSPKRRRGTRAGAKGGARRERRGAKR